MRAIEVIENLIHRIFLSSDIWKRTDSKRPGKVIEKCSQEERAILSNLKSDELSSDKISQEQIYYAVDTRALSNKHLLDFEKKLGIQPPPRKKYEEFDK